MVKWNERTTSYGNRVGRIEARLGSVLPRNQYWGTLVGPGEEPTHQLPGAPGSYSSAADLCKERERGLSPAENRQHGSSCLYQQSRGNSVKGPSLPHQKTGCGAWRGIFTYQAQHLPGVMNLTADAESRVMRDRSDWKLDQQVFLRINNVYGPLEVDLFASRLTNQCCRFFSWQPDPLAEATDAFCQNWVGMKVYANPPWNLISRVLAKTQTQGADLTLVGSRMEGTTMVCSATVNVGGLATPAASTVNPHLGINPHTTQTGRVEHLRERLHGQGLSGQATELILESWRTKTNKSYDSLFGRWSRWCGERGSDPFSGPVTEVANFLATLYQEGYQYNSVNAYGSAISSVHEKVEGVVIGQHPIITRLLKGIYNVRPPLPRYNGTWNVQTALNHLESLGETKNLTLKLLTMKTVFLLAITRPSRSADLSQLDIERMKTGTNGITFLPASLAKQSRQGRAIAEFFFPSFQPNFTICPVHTLQEYLARTRPLRGAESRLCVLYQTSQSSHIKYNCQMVTAHIGAVRN